MARPRSKHSTSSLANIGLKPEEDKQLETLLQDKGIPARQLVRALVRQWMAEGGEGVLKYSKR